MFILKQEIGQEYFGNNTFAEDIQEIIQDLPIDQQKLFITWLKNNSLDKLWKSS